MPYDAQGHASFAWQAVVRPLFDARGRELPATVGRGVYRNDDDTVLAVCGPHFKPIQHLDAVAPVLEAIEQQGHKLVWRKPAKRDLYDLKGQKGAFIDVDTAHDGAILKTTIITGDFTNPTGPAVFLPEGPPTLFRRYLILNAHNAAYAAQVAASYVVLQCMNGAVREDFAAITKAKHTTGMSIEAFRAKVLQSAELMETDTERLSLYVRSPLTLEQAREYLRATIARTAPKPDGTPQWSDSLVEKLLVLFVRQPQTVWGLYMALTEWATHGELRSNATALTARVQREERVASALRAPQFTPLLAA